MKNGHRCIKCVDEGKVVRNGKTSNGKQRFYCKSCKCSFIDDYTYQAYKSELDNQIKVFVKEGLGIRSISRVLFISVNTVLSRIKRIASKIKMPFMMKGKVYELDELCTYIGSKERRMWVVYSIRRDTKEVIGFKVGRRNNQTLKFLINRLISLDPKKVFTDKLRNYKYLIPKYIHKTKQYGTNHIERMNLSLRTHLKRLNRKTICYSKSITMLESCLRIYFWG